MALLAASMLEAALGYAELGYPVFPCAPGAKVPITERGLLDASLDPTTIEYWWQRTPAANIGLPTAGLLVVDVDPAGKAWLASREGLEGELAIGPVQGTPRGGSHFFFRAPSGSDLRNSAGRIAAGVDTRATGGYVLVAPSVVDGRPYAWRPGFELGTSPEGLPVAPAWLVDLLTAQPAMASVAATDGNPIPEGQRNATLARLAGSMRRVGMTRPEIEAALLVVNRERCHPPVPEDEVAKVAASIARRAPDQAWTAVTEGWADQDSAGEWEPDPNAPDDPGAFPADLLHVPGLVDSIVRHNLATAHRQQPVLALAAALSLQAAIAGRKVRDARGNRTNTYMIGVAPSGDGKDHARKLNRRILIEAGCGSIEGPEELASDSGLVSAVSTTPALLLQIDEIGRFMRTIATPERNPHLYQLQGLLMKLYSQADSVFLGKAYADEAKRKTIVQPCLSIYGTTVPEHLYQSLTPEALSDGFLARVLIFEGYANPERREAPETELPPEVVAAVRWWGGYQPSQLAGVSTAAPNPRVVTQDLDAANAFRDLAALSDSERRRLEGPGRSMWARVEEKACRLALVYACSQDREEPRITKAAASWACAVAEHLTRRTLYLAERWVAENHFDARRKRVLRVIEDAGHGGVSRSRLTVCTRSMTVRERSEVVEALLTTGEIREIQADTGGRPALRYVAARFASKVRQEASA